MFELEQEFIESNGLTEDQVKAILPKVTDHITTLKGEWDGKANQDAEKILSGAADKVQGLTKVERQQGEKLADYYDRAWKQYNKTSLDSLSQQKAELAEKLKKAPGNEELAKKYEELEQKYGALQEKEAELEKIKEGDFENKYNLLNEEFGTMKNRVAFQSVKPNFPDTINVYEVKAKWSEFVNGVLEKYDIVFVDDEPIAVDKENEHKQYKLQELVDKNEEFVSMMEGRKQQGPNGKPTGKRIEGLPFDLPEGADSKDRAEAIDNYLQKELKINRMNPSYSEKFSELNAIALGKKKPVAA